MWIESCDPLQTLTTLHLGISNIGLEGFHHLAKMLEINRVREMFSWCISSVRSFDLRQTLTTLDLKKNKIGPDEIKDLAEALKTNPVTRGLFSALTLHASSS